MTIKILESCMPYFIRLTHTTKHELINLGNIINEKENFDFIFNDYPKFTSKRLLDQDHEKIFKLSFLSKIQNFSSNCFFSSIFTSHPGLYYRPHKDGNEIKFGANYILQANNKECKTSWYSDSLEEKYRSLQYGKKSKEIIGFKPYDIIPEKSEIFLQNECILFNTNIYHDFNNQSSEDKRDILVIRPKFSSLSFNEVSNILLEE